MKKMVSILLIGLLTIAPYSAQGFPFTIDLSKFSNQTILGYSFLATSVSSLAGAAFIWNQHKKAASAKKVSKQSFENDIKDEMIRIASASALSGLGISTALAGLYLLRNAQK